MKRSLKYFFYSLILLTALNSCKKDKYNMGVLTSPTDVVINTTIVGQDATHPDGDGSGDVIINLTGKNVLAYKIDYNAADGVQLDFLAKSTVTKKYTTLGVNIYRITVVAYGPGASATTVTKEVTLRSDFTPDPQIVAALTGTSSKTWSVDKNVAGHFGVGPWVHDPNNGASDWLTPFWYSAPPNDKKDFSCFYTATFTFAKNSDGTFKLTVASPNGAFTKTGALAGGLPGIPASGAEGCYSYAGGSSSFSFVPSSTAVDASTPSTKTAIMLAGTNTYIGYGAVLKEYEILSITATSLYLRVQGTETGNAWYLKLKSN
jgi:hypothetical protein